MMEDSQEQEDDENYPMFSEYGYTTMEDSEEGGEEQASIKPTDDLGRVIFDTKLDCKIEKERLQFEQMLQDHQNCCIQIMKLAKRSWVAHWNY
jgi:hypothetical protein